MATFGRCRCVSVSTRECGFKFRSSGERSMVTLRGLGNTPDGPGAGVPLRRLSGQKVPRATTRAERHKPLKYRLFLAAVGLELGQIGPQVGNFRLVLDAGEGHLGAGNLGHRVLDVVLEGIGAPGDARVLVGFAVAVLRGRPGLPPIQAIELRADLVARVFADRMARAALAERLLARRKILRAR